MEGNLTLTLTLEALAPTGAVFTMEQVSAFQYSLPLKKIEAGLSTLQVGEPLIDSMVHFNAAVGSKFEEMHLVIGTEPSVKVRQSALL